MADIVWGDVTAVDAALSAVSAGAQTMILASANALRPSAFDGAAGPKFFEARAYYAAHRGRRWVDTAGSGAAGPIASESIGGMSAAYVAPATSDGDFAMTAWGQQYLSIVRSSPGARLGKR